MNYSYISKAPNFQKVIITSAFFHVLFIALAAVPLKTDAVKQESYFVNLVAPVEIPEKPEVNLQNRPAAKVRKAVVSKPQKKHVNKKKQMNKPSSGKIESLKITEMNKKTLPSSALQKIGKNEDPLKGGFIIKRDTRNNKGTTDKKNVSFERAESVPVFTPRETVQKQEGMIARNTGHGSTKKTLPDKGMSVPVFTAKKGVYRQDGIIARKASSVRHEKASIEKGQREPVFSSGKSILDKGVLTAKIDASVRSGTVTKYSGSDLEGNSDMIAIRSFEFDSPAATDGAEIKAEPGISGSAVLKGPGNEMHEDPVIGTADFQGDFGNADNADMLSSEISIQGVQLVDLSACPNALDESMLKKKILNVVGDSRGCYSPAMGKFLFLGASRFASFDMIILPESGRALSNRCDELRNAFTCLESAREQ